nr:gliding motility-associated C-terminal domain-containing protein [uncultured Mucilaginibacter sp.]
MKKYILKLSFIISFLLFFDTGKAQNQTVASGASTTTIIFPVNNCGYIWTNDHPEIGLAPSGNGNIESFTAVNTGTLPVTATITVTPVNPAAYAYITNVSSNDVSVIDTKTRQVLKTIPVGKAPYGVSASKDGSLVYITLSGENKIAVISTATQTVINTIPVGKLPYGVVVNPDGSRVYVTSAVDNTVTVINAANNTIVTTIPVDLKPSGITTSPDGAKVYVTNTNSNTVSVIDAITNSVVATIQVGFLPTLITVGVDGKNVYVANTGGHSVSVINTANYTSVEVQTPNAPKALVASPDGSRVFFSTDGFLHFITLPGNDLYSTPNNRVEGVSVTPDGSEVYFVDFHNNQVYIFNPGLTTGSSVQVGNGPNGFGNFISSGAGSCTSAPVTYTITVNPAGTITSSGNPSPLTTSYGTASSATGFNVSGTNMSAPILVTPPPGFEVSIDNTAFGNTASINATSGTVTLAPVYIRLKATSSVGDYIGDIQLSSGGGSVNVAMPNSTVTPAPLAVKANNVSKVYGSAIAGGSGFTAFTATGLQNQETIGSVTISYSSGSGVTDPVGVYSDAVMPSSATGGTFVASNYAINYINGTLTINALPASIIVPNAFTPNNDGINDIWGIPALTSYSNCLVQVYSRWGEMVFQSRGYAKPWDGTRGGAKLPVGAYYYLIVPRTNMSALSGQVTIVR